MKWCLKREIYDYWQRKRYGVRPKMNDRTSQDHQNITATAKRNTYTNANTTKMNESANNGNSNERLDHHQVIETNDNSEMEIEETTPHPEPIRNNNTSNGSNSGISEIECDPVDEFSPSLPQHESTTKPNMPPLHMGGDIIRHETHSDHHSQGSRYLFNIVGRISLDEMRQRYAANKIIIHADKMD